MSRVSDVSSLSSLDRTYASLGGSGIVALKDREKNDGEGWPAYVVLWAAMRGVNLSVLEAREEDVIRLTMAGKGSADGADANGDMPELKAKEKVSGVMSFVRYAMTGCARATLGDMLECSDRRVLHLVSRQWAAFLDVPRLREQEREQERKLLARVGQLESLMVVSAVADPFRDNRRIGELFVLLERLLGRDLAEYTGMRPGLAHGLARWMADRGESGADRVMWAWQRLSRVLVQVVTPSVWVCEVLGRRHVEGFEAWLARELDLEADRIRSQARTLGPLLQEDVRVLPIPTEDAIPALGQAEGRRAAEGERASRLPEAKAANAPEPDGTDDEWERGDDSWGEDE